MRDVIRRLPLFLFALVLLESRLWADDSTKLWMHPKAQPLEVSETGPFAQLKDGTLVTVRGGDALLSGDEGKTWTRHPISSSHQLKASPEIVVFVTREGTIVIALLNLTQEKWGWDEKENRPVEGVRLPVWTARSTDGGQTWTDVQEIQGDWCGAVRNMIQTKSGALVLGSTHLAYPQPYHTSVTYVSHDDGKSWKRSNHIDIGGRGHHDGIVEGTLVELRDGRLWYLLRTNRDVLYEAFSNHGLTWSDAAPTKIAASSSPAQLQRLESGRLVMLWNQLAPEGQEVSFRRGAPFSERPGSWHREELSMAFSDDDGQTWTKPVVLARNKPREDFAYPWILERRPGELWITTMVGDLKLRVKEVDFIAPK
jgi:sialidase-1